MRFTIRTILVLTAGTALWLTLLVHVPQLAVIIAALFAAFGLFWAARLVPRGRARDAMFVLGVLWSCFTSYLLAIALWPRNPPEVVDALYTFSFDWLRHTPMDPLLEWYFHVCGV